MVYTAGLYLSAGEKTSDADGQALHLLSPRNAPGTAGRPAGAFRSMVAADTVS